MSGVLFDLEGTLVDTLHWVTSDDINLERIHLRTTLIEMGIPEEALGNNLRVTFMHNLSLDWAEANMGGNELTCFRKELRSIMTSIEMEYAKRGKLYLDSLHTLSNLYERGVELGLVTNTCSRAADYMLRTLDLQRFFSAVVTGDDSPRLKPDPAMIKIAISKMGAPVGWLVGDTEYDAGAAYATKLKSVIVRRDGEKLFFKHDYFINSLDGVLDIVCLKI